MPRLHRLGNTTRDRGTTGRSEPVTGGGAKSWGQNSDGRLGNGTTSLTAVMNLLDVDGLVGNPGFPAVRTATAADGRTASTSVTLG